MTWSTVRCFLLQLAIETATANGDQNAIEVLEDSTHIKYVLAEKRKKVNYIHGRLCDN